MIDVVVADDEEIERRVLVRKLNRLYPGELVIREAENGQQVLDLFRARPAQILILDIEMPGVDGLEAAERIREKDAACAIIFLTAYDEFTYAKRAISVKATDYLLKPCDEKELSAAVDEAVQMYERRHSVIEKSVSESMASAGEEAAGSQYKTSVGEQDQGKDSGERPFAEHSLQDQGKGDGETAAVAAVTTEERPDIKQNADSGVLRTKERIDRYVREHFAEDISVGEVAEKLGYTEAYFCRIFKQYSGKSFVSYLTDYRIREAMRLLSDSGCTVREAGQKVGYPDPNYFTRVFRRVTGESPSEFRAGRRGDV